MTDPESPVPADTITPAAPPPITLTRLLPVATKTVWPTEPQHFTPWLLKNADLLSALLGIDVELTAAEHKVGKFSLDLFGREVESGNRVIVENQFGSTDHGHLGQLLTYAGGTKPATIIWIAEKFRDEHRAALDWLNANTIPAVRFFGITLAAVTLDGAPAGLVAPHLELAVAPNDWERAATAGSTLTSAQILYQEFWSTFEPIAKKHQWTNGSAPAQNWWSMPTGTSTAVWTVSFTKVGCRSELFFEDPDPATNLARWTVLEGHHAEINKLVGDEYEVLFDDLPTKKGCRIEIQPPAWKITDREQWPEIRAWMEATQLRLRAAIKDVGGVPHPQG
ncbi:MAG TPA: DUF4268 domain-containing protein [Pseudonocardiaceae bacterium]|jgi:hypothetical protein|nr:DUF4268 domain-containing protein [Pseudonocardiaceae bacterium]